MKVSDYIVQFLIEKGITDVFGYPGGSVTNLVDSLQKGACLQGADIPGEEDRPCKRSKTISDWTPVYSRKEIKREV